MYPLDAKELEARGGESLITKEYLVPSNYLALIGGWKIRGIGEKGPGDKVVPFVPVPSVIFFQERSVLIVRAGESGHQLVKTHVRQVWKRAGVSALKK